jgi:large subunit ribosomal protein L21e
MVRKAKGPRAGTRRLLKKKERRRLTITDVMKDFKEGDVVAIKINPSVQKGMPHVRFHGRTGRVVEKRGISYVVEIKDGNKVKRIIARPEHLKPLKA